MEQIVKKNKNRLDLQPKPRRLTSVIILLVIVTGVMSALFAGITVDLRGRSYLQGRAQTIADSLPAESISFLEGSADDVDKFEYQELKSVLERVKSNSPDLSHAYIMRFAGNEAVYLVNATGPNGEAFSQPGQVYTEGSEQLRAGITSNRAFIEGPGRDTSGIWLSAFAPITDRSTGRIVGWVGIDTPAINYYFEVVVYGLVPLCLAAIPLAGLLRDRKLQSKEWEIAQLKHQFVSIASHELRSPLTGMVWAIQSMLKSGEKNMTVEQMGLLKDMFQSAQASTATINEILDLTVFERRQGSSIQRDEIDLISVLREVQKTLRLGAQEKRLTIKLETASGTAMTNGELPALKRAFMNIISNSIKYSYEGSTIYIRHQTVKNEHVVAVQDHGIGIPEAELKKVLEGYTRASNAVRAQARGTGLGLWMTRLIVEEHGGHIELSSEENESTTMTVHLPVSQPQPTAKPKKTA